MNDPHERGAIIAERLRVFLKKVAEDQRPPMKVVKSWLHALLCHWTPEISSAVDKMSKLDGPLRLDEIVTLDPSYTFDAHNPSTHLPVLRQSVECFRQLLTTNHEVEEVKAVRWGAIDLLLTTQKEIDDTTLDNEELRSTVNREDLVWLGCLYSSTVVGIEVAVNDKMPATLAALVSDFNDNNTCETFEDDGQTGKTEDKLVEIVEMPENCDRCRVQPAAFLHRLFDPPKNLVDRFPENRTSSYDLLIFLCLSCNENILDDAEIDTTEGKPTVN